MFSALAARRALHLEVRKLVRNRSHRGKICRVPSLVLYAQFALLETGCTLLRTHNVRIPHSVSCSLSLHLRRAGKKSTVSSQIESQESPDGGAEGESDADGVQPHLHCDGSHRARRVSVD